MHQQDRNNHQMRLIVEQGIAQDRTHGSVAAWRFLASHGVPEPLILRVLSDPARRRETDNHASSPVGGALGAIPAMQHPFSADASQ